MFFNTYSELQVKKSGTVYLGGAAQVIVVNLLNRLKVNEPFQFGLVLV